MIVFANVTRYNLQPRLKLQLLTSIFQRHLEVGNSPFDKVAFFLYQNIKHIKKRNMHSSDAEINFIWEKEIKNMDGSLVRLGTNKINAEL